MTPEITAIITCYYEQRTIDEFHSRLSKALESVGKPYEIIMINDGSTDETFEHLKAIFEKDANVFCVVDFFKNAGQLAAMTAGIARARGDTFLFMDSDLQLDPEDLPRLMEEYQKGFDVVSGRRQHRKDSLVRVIPSKVANWIMRRVSGTDLKDFGCTFKLYNAKLIRAFELGPFRVFNTASVISKAQRYSEVPVQHHPRPEGKSGWTFRKLWSFNMENLVNLSEKPFQLLSAFCFLGAVLLVLRVLLDLFAPFKVLSVVSNGLLLNVLVISLLITTSTLAIVGEFVIRSFVRLQRAPAYLVRTELKRE